MIAVYLGKHIGKARKSAQFSLHLNLYFHRDNLNTGLTVYQCSNIVIQNTLFENNTAASSYKNDSSLAIGYNRGVGFRRGGALTIAYIKGDSTHTALVKNCTFRNNRAGIDASNFDRGPFSISPGGTEEPCT